MDIDVAAEGIHIATPIMARFQTFEPENTVGDGTGGSVTPNEPNRSAALENGSERTTPTDLDRDPV
jgi:hypothetical protein